MSDTAKVGLSVWVGVVIFTIFLSAAIRTGAGRDVNNHPGPLPPGVTELKGDQYLFAPTSPALPQTFCHGNGGGNGESPLGSVVRVPAQRGVLLVTCTVDQTFNDHRPIGKGFWQQLEPAIVDPLTAILLGAGLLLCLVPAGAAGVSGLRDRRRYQRNVERERQRRQVDVNDKREALAIAYANDKLTDAEYEAALDKVNAEELRRGR